MLHGALEETHPQLAEDEQVAPVAVGQLAGAVKPARVIRVGHRIIGQRGRDLIIGHVAQRIRHRMRQAVAAIPHAAELVGVQQPLVIGVGVHRPAAGGQLHLAHVGGPGIIVEVGADLDDVLPDERHRLMMIAQAVMRADLVPHGGHGVEAVGDKVGFLVVDRGEDARAGGQCHEQAPWNDVVSINVIWSRCHACVSGTIPCRTLRRASSEGSRSARGRSFADLTPKTKGSGSTRSG